MKNLFYLLSIVLTIASCKEMAEDDSTIIFTGTVTNASDNKVRLRNADIDTTFTLEGNLFTFSFQNETPSYYRFYQSGEYTTIYLRGGDSLNVSLDAADFDGSIAYSGSGAVLNQHLAESKLLKKERPSNKDLFSLNEVDFLLKMDSIYGSKSELLEKNKIEFNDDSFLKYELAKIKYDKLRDFFRFKNYHRHYASEPDFEVSENYKNNLAGFDLNDSTLLAVGSYKNFLDTYLNMRVSDRMEKDTITYNPEKETASYVKATMDQIEESFTNNQVKSSMMYDFLYIYMTYMDHAIFEEYLKNFSSINSNEKNGEKLNSNFASWKKLAKGATAPNFKYASIEGDSVTMDDFKGKYVYIDVWATWCGPCLRELPSLEALQEEYKDKNITFMSISIDNTPKPWKKMVEEKEMKGVQLYADGAWNSTLANDYMISSIPRFILVDTEGKLISPSTERPSGGIKEILDALEHI